MRFRLRTLLLVFLLLALSAPWWCENVGTAISNWLRPSVFLQHFQYMSGQTLD